jgi:hypothetical protein
MVMFAQNLLLWGMMAEEKIPDKPQLVFRHTPILPTD